MRGTLRLPLRSDSAAGNALFATVAMYLLVFTISPVFTYEITQILKYAYTVQLVSVTIWCLVTFLRFNPNPAFLIGPFLLSVIGAISFVIAIAMTRNPVTYGSALIPLLTAAVPLFLPDRAVDIDVPRLLRWLLAIFLISGAVHVFAQLTAGGEIDFRLGHGSTFIILFAAILAGVRRDWRMFAVAFILAVTSLVLRPSSTLMVALMVVSLYVWAHWMGWGRLAVAIVFWATTIIVVMNLLIVFEVPAVDVMMRFEPWLKEEILGAQSNNVFRLAVLQAAIDEYQKGSLVLGTFFTGGVNVSVRHLLPGWDIAPIHNDFVNVSIQGGIVGSILFASIFIGLAAAARTGLAMARAIRDPSMVAFFSSAIGANFVFAIYAAFNPMLQLVDSGVFYLVWIPLSVFALRHLKLRVVRARRLAAAAPTGLGGLAPVPPPHRHV